MGGVDKLRIKLSQLSRKVEVEVEAELGYMKYKLIRSNFFISPKKIKNNLDS